MFATAVLINAKVYGHAGIVAACHALSIYLLKKGEFKLFHLRHLCPTLQFHLQLQFVLLLLLLLLFDMLNALSIIIKISNIFVTDPCQRLYQFIMSFLSVLTF